MQVRYQPAADRVLWQLRTTGGELYAVWLTRRMVRLVWPHLQRLVAGAALAQVAPRATVLPEAQAMLADVARTRPLPGASFGEPFQADNATRPQGAEPLLPDAIDLGAGPGGSGLKLSLREPGGRHLSVQLGDDLATALLRLLEQAVAGAEWDFAPPPAIAAPERPATLN